MKNCLLGNPHPVITPRQRLQVHAETQHREDSTMAYPEPVPANWQTPPREFHSDMDRLNWLSDALELEMVVDEPPPTRAENDRFMKKLAGWVYSVLGTAPEDQELEAAARQLGYDIEDGEWEDLQEIIENLEIDDIRKRAGITGGRR